MYYSFDTWLYTYYSDCKLEDEYDSEKHYEQSVEEEYDETYDEEQGEEDEECAFDAEEDNCDDSFDEYREIGNKIADFLDWDDWNPSKVPRKPVVSQRNTECPSARLTSSLEPSNKKYVTIQYKWRIIGFNLQPILRVYRGDNAMALIVNVGQVIKKKLTTII